MFLIGRDEELTTLRMASVLNDFQTKELPRLRRYWNYYQGKQAITRKQPSDVGRENNRIVANYCYTITQNYLGYLTGVPIAYEGEYLDEIKDVLLYNDVKTEDNELLRLALIYGRSFELNYIDEDGKERFRTLDSRTCIPIYDDTLNNDLLYVIRFWKEDHISNHDIRDRYIVELYSADTIKRYRSSSGFTSFELIEEKPHFYGQCPVSVFSLNEDETSIYDQVMSLQDAYNSLISDEIDTFNDFANAYLIMKGVIADTDDLNDAKTKRAFMIDNDADISYLTKNVSDTQIENMLKNINDQIYKISNCPDFTDKEFMAQTGIALRLKLTGFENVASSIEAHMRKMLQRRIELLAAIAHLKNGDAENVWRDVQIRFTRNLPTDNSDLVALVQGLRGLVSDETLLALLPFVDNVAAEMERVNAQKAATAALYNFGSIDADDDNDDF